MEHPPKQGLKQHPFQPLESYQSSRFNGTSTKTRIETRNRKSIFRFACECFNGTSTKTRIETRVRERYPKTPSRVLMEHPPKQGLKRENDRKSCGNEGGFNGTSTKTRIETDNHIPSSTSDTSVLMEHPPKQGLKLHSRT